MAINKNKRLLTLGYKMDDEYYSPRWHPEKRIPVLRLSGKWLKEAGFLAGDIIEVDVQDGCLTIRKTYNKWKMEVISKKWMVNENDEPIPGTQTNY